MRLPDFIGIGAPRCGTTWLSHLMNQHPQIYMDPNIKEIHFFDKNFQRGNSWYNRFFEGQPHHVVCGEFTPSYMHLPKSFSRMHQTNPDAKIIVNLREPVSRAFSHYMQRKRFTRDMDSFELTVRKNSDQILDFGLYGEQLKELYQFFPAEQVHVIIFEELVAQPEKILQGLFEFLNVGIIPINLDQASKNQMIRVRFIWIKQFMRGLRSLARKFHFFRKIFFVLLPGEKVMRFLGSINSIPESVTKDEILPETEQFLQNFYAGDRLLLEQILQRPMNQWH